MKLQEHVKRILKVGEYSDERTHGTPRSPQWSGVRDAFLKTHKECAACGGAKNIQIHHVQSFATHPQLELDPTNFLPLCEGMERNCHRFIGHLDNYQSLNEQSREDAATWLQRVQRRPRWDGAAWVYPA